MKRQTRLNPAVRDAIRCVKDTIDQKPLERKTITAFANETGIGRNLLQKYFRQLFRIRINEYQKRKRMEVAAGMLEEGRLTIQKIASKCGYNSQSSFARVFKEVYRTSPTKWKNGTKIPE
jgi:AraC-like DNA-binding protein